MSLLTYTKGILRFCIQLLVAVLLGAAMSLASFVPVPGPPEQVVLLPRTVSASYQFDDLLSGDDNPDTPTPTDNDGTDSDGIDTPTPTPDTPTPDTPTPSSDAGSGSDDTDSDNNS
ncbi:MAG: hypothetical protein OXI91_15460 [Chloroflexota bacterium]|nr:hypothetical protein [Chloroflexota bacterium]